MSEADTQLDTERAGGEQTTAISSPPARAKVIRRRTRLARGPLTIGEPAAAVDARLAAVDPYRPDTVADGGEAFGLTVRAASVRGLYKRHLGGPRQDDLCLRVHPPTRSLIAAVADGVSAAARSDLAAALAVRHAAANVDRQLEQGAVDVDWSEVFHHAAWALVEEQRRSGGDAQAGIAETAASLATTLTVAVITPTDDPDEPANDDAGDPADPNPPADDDAGDPADPDPPADDEVGEPADPDPPRFRVQVAGVGDSPAYVLAEGRFDSVLGDAPSVDGLIGAGTRALPRDVGAVDCSTCSLASGSVLLMCSDGLALPLAGGAGEVGQTLARELANPPDIIDFARLLDFSRVTYDDDRTLIAVWPGQQR